MKYDKEMLIIFWFAIGFVVGHMATISILAHVPIK